MNTFPTIVQSATGFDTELVGATINLGENIDLKPYLVGTINPTNYFINVEPKKGFIDLSLQESNGIIGLPYTYLFYVDEQCVFHTNKRFKRIMNRYSISIETLEFSVTIASSYINPTSPSATIDNIQTINIDVTI